MAYDNSPKWFDDVLSAMAGQRMPLHAGASKVLSFMLDNAAGCDAIVARDGFTIRFGWHGARRHTYYLELAPAVISHLLEWGEVIGPAHDVRVELAPRSVTTEDFHEWSFGRRILWARMEGDKLHLSVRDAAGAAQIPQPLPEPLEPPLVLMDFVDALPCPHCALSATQYRQLSCGSLVCSACGCSFRQV